MAAKAVRLKLTLHEGHKGIALVFPFDPNAKWGARHFVAGTLNGVRFEGEIGFRRRAFSTLLDDELLAAAGLGRPRDAGELGVVAFGSSRGQAGVQGEGGSCSAIDAAEAIGRLRRGCIRGDRGPDCGVSGRSCAVGAGGIAADQEAAVRVCEMSVLI